MSDETKKDNYYQEQWAKIQVEKHENSKKAEFWYWMFTLAVIIYWIVKCSY